MPARPPDRARLALLIEDITGANRMEIERRLQVVARVFEDVLPLLPVRSSGPGTGSGESERRPASPDERDLPQDGDGDSGLGFLDIPSLLGEPALGSASLSRRSESAFAQPPESTSAQTGEPRIEVVFPGGRISLPETVASLDVIIQVLQERRSNLSRGNNPASF